MSIDDFMSTDEIVYYTAALLFVFTLIFSYGYYFVSPMVKTYSYIKCLTGGFIISIILFEILPDLYVHKSVVPPLATGLSFFALFAISKLYIEKVDAEDHDSIPGDATKKEALIFIVALSLHSFMEGLGVSTKTGDKLGWYICGLFAHKWLEALVLGASVLSSRLSKRARFSLLLVYSSLTSIGAILGMHISKRESEASVLLLILDGIAAGSFFYIAFVEMVGNEFQEGFGRTTKEKTWKKVLSMFSGFTGMTGLIIAVERIAGQ